MDVVTYQQAIGHFYQYEFNQLNSYFIYAIFWLICSLCYWRDLLRIQIWIGGVILLGLMEKAAYLAEYDGIDRNGYSCKLNSRKFF